MITMRLLLTLFLAVSLAGCATAPRHSLTPVRAGSSETVSYLPKMNLTVKDSFIWPVKGYLLSPFGAKVDRVINKGIDIRAEEGSSVRAARAGRVVYCDSRLKGFGKTVILDHGDGFQTVYSYNSEILVNVGDTVNRNDVIAKAGMTGRAKEPCLHFEIRKNSRPQDPERYLP